MSVTFDLQRFAGERPLAATPRRRQRAREQGQIARSEELGGAAALAAAALALRVTAVGAARLYAGWAAGLWSELPGRGLDGQSGAAVLVQGGRAALGLVGPVLAVPLVAAVGVGIAQTGLAFTPSALAPDFNRLNPVRGVQGLFSRRSLVELARSLLKAGGVAVACAGPLLGLFRAASQNQRTLGALAGLTLEAAETMLLRAAIVLAVAAVGDLLYRRYELDVQLRMTRQEARDETRESEGDPGLRARRRRRAREMARRRMLADVRHADVVLANPTHFAVALRYDADQMAAPVVVAKGADFLAQRIRDLAAAAGVPIVENPPLARSLYAGVKVGGAIPAALYQAVAEVLAFVWRVRGRI